MAVYFRVLFSIITRITFPRIASLIASIMGGCSKRYARIHVIWWFSLPKILFYKILQQSASSALNNIDLKHHINSYHLFYSLL